ncbi:hypothetical protein D3C75_1363530 [compost metagenome]
MDAVLDQLYHLSGEQPALSALIAQGYQPLDLTGQLHDGVGRCKPGALGQSCPHFRTVTLQNFGDGLHG